MCRSYNQLHAGDTESKSSGGKALSTSASRFDEVTGDGRRTATSPAVTRAMGARIVCRPLSSSAGLAR